MGVHRTHDRSKLDYSEVAETFTILTVVPYVDEPEYREYTVGKDELCIFIQEMRCDQHAEEIVTIEGDD